MSVPTYVEGSELPSITRDWYDDQGDLVDLSAASFVVRIGIPGRAAVVEKTAGVTGAATAPNLTITWSAGELDDLTPGRWPLRVTATTSGKQRDLRMAILIRSAIAAPA